MTDVLKIAEKKRNDFEAAIAKREREIEELRTRIAELTDFLEFGQMLTDEDSLGATPSAEPRNVDALDAGSPRADADAAMDQSRKVHLERSNGLAQTTRPDQAPVSDA